MTPSNPAPVGDERNPRAFIDMNGGYQSQREGLDKEAHDAWVKTTTWNLTRDDFIRLSYFHGCLEDGDDGRHSERHPINGSTFKPGDVVYIGPNGGALTRSMVSQWLSDYSSFTHGYKVAAQARASSAAPVGDERTQFEAWAGSMESWLPNIKRRYNSYEAATTAAAWHAWETRAARSTVQQVGADALDAARYRRLKPWFAAANFRPEDMDLSEGVALIFIAPVGLEVSSDLDSTIDEAPGSDGGKGS